MAQQRQSKTGKTWQDKLHEHHPNHGKVVRIPPKMQARFGRGRMLIPRPLDVDAIIRRVRKGRLLTQSRLREKLAAGASADCACPLTTGIFLRIVSEAAEESRRAGRKRITPYWRVIKDDGSLNERFPGGAAGQAKRLRAEGHSIAAAKGKKPPKVLDFEESLVRST